MSDIPLREITIYHKNNNKWERYTIEASYRNKSILENNKNGENSTDNSIIRIFDQKGYKIDWFVQKGDIIVNKKVEDDIEGSTPITQLSSKYGKDNIHKVISVDDFIFDDKDIEELNHIKIGAI